MHINGSGPINQFLKTAANEQQDKDQASNKQGNPQQGVADQVTLTGKASQLQSIEQALVSQPVVNTQRVEQVQDVVNAGKLDMNPAQIADKMMNFEGALNGARTGT